jgi:organic hydroperoxide reductase OsmC/OhrA
MSKHRATLHWKRGDSEFLSGRYSREHTWTFDGGAVITASPSPALVPTPYSNPDNVDPEEAFVAAISSCHMLTFLYLASLRGLQIDSYRDEAVGEITKDRHGIAWMSAVTLQTRIVCSGSPRVTTGEVDLLQHQAHEQCFIANSVRTTIIVSSDVTWAP